MMRTAAITAAAFLMAFAVFGGVMLVPLLARESVVVQETADTQTARGELWVVMHDEGRLTALVKIGIDTGIPSVQVVGYPPETEVVYGVEVTTAAELFERYGERVTTFIDACECVCLSVGGFSTLMGRLSGNLPMVLRQPVTGLTAGTYTVTPLQMAGILRFSEWEDGGIGAARVHAEAVAVFLDRVLTETRDARQSFYALTDVCDTRLRISQFAAVEKTVAELCRINDGALCTATVATGKMVGTGERLRYVCD